MELGLHMHCCGKRGCQACSRERKQAAAHALVELAASTQWALVVQGSALSARHTGTLQAFPWTRCLRGMRGAHIWS